MMLCTIAAIFSLAFCTIVRSVSPSSNNWRQFSSATVQKKGEGGGYLVQVSMWGHSALQLSLRDFTCYDYTLYYNILWPYSFLVIWSAGVFFCTYMYHMGLEIILFLFFYFLVSTVLVFYWGKLSCVAVWWRDYLKTATYLFLTASLDRHLKNHFLLS